MFSTLRTRFGIPGVISVMALVFAMFGGAYAASNSSGGGKATASAKAKQGPRGKTGKTGPAGPAGPAGPVGPAGAKGENGAAGANGSNGTPGSPGASVAVEEFAGTKEGHCTVGGSKFTVGASKSFACNGEEGIQGSSGPEGVCSTSNCHLPVNVTETGIWTVHPQYTDAFAYAPISFSIPLAGALDAAHAVFAFEDESHCPGSNAEPLAASGYLCVYGAVGYAPFAPAPNVLLPTASLLSGGAGVGGAVLKFEVEGAAAQAEGVEIRGAGAFAVTG